MFLNILPSACICKHSVQNWTDCLTGKHQSRTEPEFLPIPHRQYSSQVSGLHCSVWLWSSVVSLFFLFSAAQVHPQTVPSHLTTSYMQYVILVLLHLPSGAQGLPQGLWFRKISNILLQNQNRNPNATELNSCSFKLWNALIWVPALFSLFPLIYDNVFS